MSLNVKEHWENIYQTKNTDEMSWYQDKPNTSLDLIAELDLDKSAEIIYVFAGNSKNPCP